MQGFQNTCFLEGEEEVIRRRRRSRRRRRRRGRRRRREGEGTLPYLEEERRTSSSWEYNRRASTVPLGRGKGSPFFLEEDLEGAQKKKGL